MVKEIKIKQLGEGMLEVGFESRIFRVPKKFLEEYKEGLIGFERERINKWIDDETKELEKVDKNIPEKFKELIGDETNQHMRLEASLSILKRLKGEIK